MRSYDNIEDFDLIYLEIICYSLLSVRKRFDTNKFSNQYFNLHSLFGDYPISNFVLNILFDINKYSF